MLLDFRGWGSNSKNWQLGLHELNIICISNETLRRARRQSTKWENIFCCQCIWYREYIKNLKKSAVNSANKWQKWDLKGQFSKEESPIFNNSIGEMLSFFCNQGHIHQNHTEILTHHNQKSNHGENKQTSAGDYEDSLHTIGANILQWSYYASLGCIVRSFVTCRK